MRKIKLITLIVAMILVVGGLFFIKQRPTTTPSSQSAKTTQQKAPEDVMEVKKDQTATVEPAKKPTETIVEQPQARPGRYISLGEFNAQKSNYSTDKNIYFFHASWCPVCKSIDKEINADLSRLPKNTNIIKVDYDNADDLRKKYGVTQQYTFVQFDNNDSKIAKWNATNLNAVISGIK
jgi:thiol-disulfide isomerase/thioredoxin